MWADDFRELIGAFKPPKPLGVDEQAVFEEDLEKKGRPVLLQLLLRIC